MAETAAGVFPDLDVQWDVKLVTEFRTEILTSYSGREQRRKVFGDTPYRRVTCSSFPHSADDRKTIKDFLVARRGTFQAFYFFRRDLDKFSSYNVGTISGTGSGGTNPHLDLTIPFKDSTITSITVGGTPVVWQSTDDNSGTYGEDRITFSNTVAGGIVLLTLQGRERLLVRSLYDEIDESFVQQNVPVKTVFNLGFKEVR